MRKLKLFLSMLMLIAFSVGNVWADVVSGTAYTTTSGSFPTGWSKHSGNEQSKYIGLYSGDYIQTENFCQNGFTSIVVSARKLNGPSDEEKVLTIEWIPEDGSDAVVLGTVSPGGTSLANLTLSDFSSTPTANTSGSIKLSCKAAPAAKGDGVGAVTINYTAGTCGGGTPTCSKPTFSPAAGSYEGTQNVTITSTTGATIYYTTDGSTPTTTSSVYSTAIPVAADMTIKAYAVKSEYNDSEVAEAAYTITEGPDVTIAFVGNTNWNIPSGSSSKTVDEGTYTDGTYTIKIAGSTGEGYYINGYLLLGKTGAYVELPEFSNPVEKIVVVGTSGGSTGVKFNIYDGTTAVSTEVTGCKNVSQEFEIADPAANKAYKVQVTSNANLQISAIKIYFGAAPAVAKPTISGDENFVTSTTVTISHADADHIYYTTDGSDPKTSGTKQTYSVPFTVNADGTTTVKAYAVKGSDESDVASKTFTKVTPMTTAAALRSFATSSAQNAFIQLDGWKVTFVNGNNAYIVDPSNEGVILNNASHGYVAGDELNDEVVEASVKLASGRVQLSGFTSSDITATAGTVSPVEVTDFSTVVAANQSRLVTLKDATYSSSDGTFSDGANVIYYYDQFSASPTLVDAATYDVTGVVIYYKNNTTDKVQVAPRTAADVVATSAVVIPTAANLAALKAAARGTYILTLTNAVVTYVNGNNAFIEDATGGALIYFASHGYSAGDCLNGDYQVVTTDYQGKFEITAMEPQAGAATTTAEIPLTTVTIATLNASFSSYESRRIKIAGANVTDAISGSDRNGAINDGAALAVYAAVANTITLTADDNVDIIGYPGFHNTDQQLTVWRQEDITVNEKDPAGIAFTPESETITDGDPWSAPAFTNPNNLDVTFGTSNDEVATVSNTGVVSLEGGYGTAVITAHTDGDATHNAGNATYTITVNDPSSVDTRKIAESPAAGFSSIEGDLSGNEISYAAYKGGASSAPNANNTANELRLYKYQATTNYGGYVTITAKTGCTIDQVVITVSANCNVGYCKDAEELPTKESTPIAIGTSSPFDTGTGLNASSVSVVNLDASNQFKIKSITVYYTGEAATLQSIAISGTASVLEYNDGDEFNPAGLVVTGHYSDNTDAEITDGITWAFDPATLSEGDASVSVTATVGTVTSDAVVVDGLTVSAAAVPTVDNVVILATYDSKYYAMSTNNVSSAFTAIAVEYDGSQVTVNSAEDKAAIQWTRTVTGDNTTFQDADDKYMKSADGTAMSLQDAVCNWVWDENGYYKIPETARTFFYQNGTGFKNFATSNFNKTGYSDKAQVIVIDPANIVITSKVSAELAYDPASDEITQGDAWSAPTLVNPYSVTITSYNSDNEAVATVTGGVIALAGGIGTANITAHFDGDASYLEGDAVYTITVNAPAPTPTGTTYRKVTATSDITDGEYLIVYEGDATHDAYAFNGSLADVDQAKKGVAVTINEGVISGTTELDAATFTIDLTAGTLQSASGWYIGRTENSNGMEKNETTEYVNTFAINEGEAVITSSGGPTLRYNYASDQLRFRYYKSGQQSIQLYKKETPTKDLIRDGLSNGKWGTLCPKQNVENVEGATFYQISYLEENGGLPYNMVFDQISGTTLTAGQPYFFIASANEIRGNKTGAVLDAAGAGVNGFYGYIGAEPMHLSYLAEYTPGSNNTYVIYGNMVTRLNGPTDLKSERCYININSTEPSRSASAPMPGRARFMINVGGHNTPTGMDQITNDQLQMSNKVIINGHLYILRGEKMYDATGRLVK